MCYTDGSTADREGVETMKEPLVRISGPLLADAELLYDFLSECPPLPERADIILAAGSHDCRAADHAAALYLRGLAPLIVCTGGFGKMTEGMFTKPEAEVFAERCAAAGVPAGAIITECRASNTGENFTFTREKLAALGLAPKIGIAASKPYMARRVWATGTRQWPEVRWFTSVPALSFAEYVTPPITLESTVQLMVGDLQRLRVYEEKGFQAHVDIPAPVWEAYRRLADGGFDRYVIRE